VGYLAALDALSDSVNAQPKMAGGLVYGHTASGLRSWVVLSHEGILDH
jgi:hypothetical protein